MRTLSTLVFIATLSACTFVRVAGDNNHICDIREYVGLSLPDHSGAQPAPLQRFMHPQHQGD
jgi:hypothetical protein